MPYYLVLPPPLLPYAESARRSNVKLPIVRSEGAIGGGLAPAVMPALSGACRCQTKRNSVAEIYPGCLYVPGAIESLVDREG